MIEIGAPELSDDATSRRIQFAVRGLATDTLWIEVPREFGHFLSDLSDAAAVALVAPAMFRNAPLHIAGDVSASVIWTLNSVAVPVLSRTLGGTHRIAVEASRPVSGGVPTGDAVITGLSCGIDSLSACHDYLMDPALPPAQRVSHCVFNDVGSHGPGGGYPGLAAVRAESVARAAELLHVPLIRVRSNLPSFFQDWPAPLHFAATHSLRNAAIALALQKGTRRFLYASSQPWSRIRVRRGDPMGHVEPMLLPALSTPALEIRCVGQDYERVEKTAQIADMEVAQRYLDVCTVALEKRPAPTVNCSRCFKCLRTLLTLELIGKLDAFDQVFDLARYAKVRGRYIADVYVGNKGENEDDVRALLKRSNLSIPKQELLAALARRARTRVAKRFNLASYVWAALPSALVPPPTSMLLREVLS